jgi:diamine N-acetyltransferase
MHIKPVTLADIPALSRLASLTFSETFGHLYPPEDLSAFLEASYGAENLAPDVGDPRHFWRVIWDEDEPIAYLQCKPVGLPHLEASPEHEGEISRLYIHNAYQGKGLGRRLMTEAFGWLDTAYGPAPQWLGVGEYKFPVGQTLDDEFILRRQP